MRNLNTALLAVLLAGILLTLPTSCRKEKALSNNELINLAAKEGKDGNWKGACSYAKKAVAQNPKDVKARVLFAIALDRYSMPELALDEAREAVKLDPNNFLAQYTLGKILYDNKNYKACIPPLEKANELKKQNPFVLVLLAQACRELKKPEALKYFFQLSRTNIFKDKPSVYNELGVILMQTKQVRMATEKFLKAKNLDPDNPTIALNLAVFCDKKVKNYGAAKKFYQKYLQLTEANHAEAKKRSEVEARLKVLGSR